jgi:hypothetical protein
VHLGGRIAGTGVRGQGSGVRDQVAAGKDFGNGRGMACVIVIESGLRARWSGTTFVSGSVRRCSEADMEGFM